MKQLIAMTITVLFLAGIFQTSQDQTEKGNWLLGGSGSFKHYNYPSSHITSNIMVFNADGGLFVIDNLAVGIFPMIQWNTTHVESNNPNFDRTSSAALSIGPFVRYYVGVVDKINLFITANYNFGHHFTSQKSDPSEKYSFDQYRIGLGSAFFLSKTAALQVSVGYMHYHTFSNHTVINPPANNTENMYNLLDIEVGFNIYLPGK